MADETNEPTDTDAVVGDTSPETSDRSDAVTGDEPKDEPKKVVGTDEPKKVVGTDEPKKVVGTDEPKKVVAKKKVVSKRVTPKGGHQPGSTAAHAHAPGGDDAQESKRYTPPSAKYQDMPSPTWVPVLMFTLLGFGALFIIVNYAGLFGDPENWRLMVGLAAILGGIIAATNYR